MLGAIAIPFVVTFIGLYATQQITQQQAQLSETTNKQRHQIDIQIANDQQQEVTLQEYLDRMSDLLLNGKLRNSKPDDEVRKIARARTLTALRRVNLERKNTIARFLSEANLIEGSIVDLSGADLSGIELSGVNWAGANLSGADLRKVRFTGVNLSYADMRNADLSESNLGYIQLRGYVDSGPNYLFNDLHGADLYGAKLYGANLEMANLEHTNLTFTEYNEQTDLRRADLKGAGVGKDTCCEGANLQGATMPDGSIHP